MSQVASGFVEIESPAGVVRARPEAEAWARYALDTHGSLYRAAAGARDSIRMDGRGPVYAIPARPDEVEAALGAPVGRWVVRHSLRGGMMARVLGDRYLKSGSPRPFEELRASEKVRARRIPTPRVVAAAVYPAGIFYRGDLVTTFVPDAVELASILFDPDRGGVSGTVDRRDALMETGYLIRRMGVANVYHPDLNARNILLEWTGGAPHAHLVDLDRCRIESRGGADAVRRMHGRLLRSIHKLGKRAGLPVPAADLDVLRRAVAER